MHALLLIPPPLPHHQVWFESSKALYRYLYGLADCQCLAQHTGRHAALMVMHASRRTLPTLPFEQPCFNACPLSDGI